MVQAELGDKGIADWDDLPRLATDALTTSSTSVRPYREIIIDEAQDATPGIIDLCRRQLPGTGTGLFACGARSNAGTTGLSEQIGMPSHHT